MGGREGEGEKGRGRKGGREGDRERDREHLSMPGALSWDWDTEGSGMKWF